MQSVCLNAWMYLSKTAQKQVLATLVDDEAVFMALQVGQIDTKPLQI